MKTIQLDRTEAEWLVDILEKCDPKVSGTWRFDLAGHIRETFGMVSKEQEDTFVAEKRIKLEGINRTFKRLVLVMLCAIMWRVSHHGQTPPLEKESALWEEVQKFINDNLT